MPHVWCHANPRRRSPAFAVVAALSGCEAPQDDPDFPALPIRHLTEELEIATSFEQPLCGADLSSLDAHTRWVEDLLGVDADPLRTLYVYDFWPMPGCPADRPGCFRRDVQVAVSVPVFLRHELVHAASVDLGRPADFWNEGLAEALSERPLIYEPAELTSAVELKSNEFSYAIPGHFVRWLIDWGGMDAYLEVFAGSEFSDVYGMELEAVEQIYDAEAPVVLAPSHPCDAQPLLPDSEGIFDLTATLACDEPGTTRIAHGYDPEFLGVVRVVEVTEPTTFTLRVEGGYAAFVGGCQSDPGVRVDELGDVVNETAEPPLPERTFFEIGIEHEMSLPPWKYRVYLVAEDRGEPVEMRLHMLPE